MLLKFSMFSHLLHLILDANGTTVQLVIYFLRIKASQFGHLLGLMSIKPDKSGEVYLGSHTLEFEVLCQISTVVKIGMGWNFFFFFFYHNERIQPV